VDRVREQPDQADAVSQKSAAPLRSPQVAEALALQRSIGNRATAQQLSREPKAVGDEFLR
jgi:hypothetical protein